MWVCFSGWRCMCKLGLIMSKSSWKWREERPTLSGEMLFHSIPSISLCISSLSTSMILHCGPLLSSSPLLRTLLFLIDWSKIFRLFYLYYLSFLHLHLCLLCHSCRCILLCFWGKQDRISGRNSPGITNSCRGELTTQWWHGRHAENSPWENNLKCHTGQI